jgi:hypothetical protein
MLRSANPGVIRAFAGITAHNQKVIEVVFFIRILRRLLFDVVRKAADEAFA